MKVIVAVLSLLVPISAFSGETLSLEAIQGKWVIVPPSRTLSQKIVGFFADTEPETISIEISGKQATLKRESENSSETVSAPDGMQKIGDLFFVELPRENGGKYQVVLGGWKIEGNGMKQLFGYMYLFNEAYLFNGWPVSFVPAGT